MTTEQSPQVIPAPWQEALARAALPPAGPELMVALDIDGTTIRHDTSLSERMRAAIHAHLDAGTHIMFATGRGIGATQVVLDQVGFERGHVVSSNGALIMAVGDAHPESETTALPKAIQANDVPLRLLKAHTFNPHREVKLIAENIAGVRMALETLTEAVRITEPFPEGELIGPQVVVPLEYFSLPNATRLTVRAPNHTPQELLAAVGELGLAGCEYAVGFTGWMDLAPEGINKATALEEVRQELGVKPQHTVAIGDSGNDCEMLQWAGVGIVMKNSPDYVREFADGMTEHVDDDGAALVLEALL